MNPVILTRNAYHGGVETIIAAHQRQFHWPVIVCGGLEDPQKTCPFKFEYLSSQAALVHKLQDFDLAIYHWLPDWAVQAVRIAKKKGTEYLHRLDTADCDKSVPDLVLTHSRYILTWLQKQNLNSRLVPYPVDTAHYLQVEGFRDKIGAVTAYTLIKGLDVAIRAAGRLRIPLRFYGSGDATDYFRRLSRFYMVKAAFKPPVGDPARVWGEFEIGLFPARIEGGPISICEAMASDVPVVASNIQAHIELNEVAEELGFPPVVTLFESENAIDLAEKILVVRDNPNHPREFAKAFTSMRKHLDGIGEILNDL